jgi:hypothetical protein
MDTGLLFSSPSHVTHSGNRMQPHVNENHETLCKGRYLSMKLLLPPITHRFLCLSFPISVKVGNVFCLTALHKLTEKEIQGSEEEEDDSLGNYHCLATASDAA